MKLYNGQIVKVKIYGVRPGRWNQDGHMDKYMGKIVTIVDPSRVKIWEDDGLWTWNSTDFEEILQLPDNLFEI